MTSAEFENLIFNLADDIHCFFEENIDRLQLTSLIIGRLQPILGEDCSIIKEVLNYGKESLD